jgi:hypothetical protein
MPYFNKPTDTATGAAVLEVLLRAHAECDEDSVYGVEWAVEQLYGVRMFQALAAGEEIEDHHYAG